MRSSRSTLSRSSESGPRLYVLLTGEDHPKACTGRRLVHRGLATVWTRAGTPIVLDPRAGVPLLPSDEARAEVHGLLVVDCSWNRLHARGGFSAEFRGLSPVHRRRLPWLLAGNPQHYGRLGELNTAEAFAAALEILGDHLQAERVLSTFAGGPGFLSLNAEPLAAYRQTRSAEELAAAEKEFF